MRYRLLDLFCCGGGAGVGYARSGFTVTGIDIKNQPEYPYEFIECDAVEYLQEHGHKFDAIHASPPCQAYSSHVTSSSSKFVPTKGKDEPMLIGVLRDILNEIGKPYVIENVIGARQHMDANLMLCGTMLDCRSQGIDYLKAIFLYRNRSILSVGVLLKSSLLTTAGNIATCLLPGKADMQGLQNDGSK